MGNESSTPKEREMGSQSSSAQSGSSSGWQHNYAQSSFSQYARNYPIQQPYPAGYPPLDPQHASHNYGPPPGYPPPDPQHASHNYGPPPGYPTSDPQYPSHNYGPPPGYPTADPQYPSQNYGIPESNMPTQHGGPSEPNIPTQYGVPQSQIHAPAPQKKFDRRYSRIADHYNSLEEVSEALARAGLESSNLIVGIDYTKSNEWTGKHSYNGQSLHHIGAGLNPYEQAISIIGKTLAVFDDDNLIPCYGFGDVSTHDQDVFSFYPDGRHCKGFEEVLRRYRELTPNLKLAGPTSFAPIIEMAMTVVQQSRCQYHVLLILADGQVTRSVDTEYGQLSPQEQKTVQAIVEASKLPLSIILVGVGDGPWDTMKEFDDNIPAREFDNFQFVNFTEIMSKQVPHGRKEREFALTALMEIPSQYKATLELNLLGAPKQNVRERVALPPPVHGGTFGFGPEYSSPVTRGRGVGPYNENKFPLNAAPSAPFPPSAPIPTYEPEELQHRICPICLSNPKDMAFGCGHQTCCDCGRELQLCPICRSRIETRIKLYQ